MPRSWQSAMGLALPSAPAAAETVEIGQPAEVELVEIEVEQHWTGRRPPSER